MLPADLLDRRKTHFTLWRPNGNTNAPKLVIGKFQAGNPNVVANRLELSLVSCANTRRALRLSAPRIRDWRTASITTGIGSTIRIPGVPREALVLVTDPFATTVDWRVLSEIPAGFNAFDDPQPASVIRLANGTLSAVDPAGEVGTFPNDTAPDTLPANNRTVIYELPTAWTSVGETGGRERAVGTFKDVLGPDRRECRGRKFRWTGGASKGPFLPDGVGR